MIILNQNNGKKIYGKKYIYNLYSNKSTIINKFYIKSNIKKNIIFGFIGKDKKYIFNPIYYEDETIINTNIENINIELQKGDNYIYIYCISDVFEIKIEENIILSDIKIMELNNPYIIEKSNNFDLIMNKDQYYFLAYINDPAQNNFYEIELNNQKINSYEKNDNFLNFIGTIETTKENIYTLSLNMKYLINILKIIIIHKNNNIINKTNYYNNDNIYKIKPVIAFNDISINSYYIELKLNNYDNNTRISFEKNDKIVFKIINDILYVNNIKVFKYNKEFIKIIFTFKDNYTNIYIFNTLPNKRFWYKITSVKSKLTFYQKLFEDNYFDSHKNIKSIIFKKPYIFKFNNNKFLENVYFKYYNDEPKKFIDSYILTFGGYLNYEKLQLINPKNKKITFNSVVLKDSIPISVNIIDFNGNKIVNNIPYNIPYKINNNIYNNPNYESFTNKKINTPIKHILNNIFLFDLFIAFVLITLIIIISIKIFNR